MPDNPTPVIAPAFDDVWNEATRHLVGRSEAHVLMLLQLQRITSGIAPTLIEGETGCGKEMAARAIHYGGARRAGPFVPVNCGALPDTLIETELFGVERGAFTDARQSRRGLVAEACHGSLFLDEIDALSLKAQVTLLRFLQDQSFRPVGSARELRTDTRVIAAANRPLDDMVAQGGFRADLMYRLKILHLVLPPLRERADDVELLARHFVDRLQERYGGPRRELHPDTLTWLHRHSWPGNVRELENWVHRRFLMSPGRHITHDDGLPVPVTAAESAAALPLARFQAAKAEAVRSFEQDYLRRVMHDAAGNVTRAAQMAGKERRAFGKLLKKHGLSRAEAC